MLTGDEYFDSNEFRDKLMSYEDSVRSGHHIFLDADDLADIADYYNLIGNYVEANDVIEYALNIHPGATLPLVFKARQALMLKEIEKAEEYANDIYNKDDPDYKYLIAEILIAQNKISEAENFLKEYYSEIQPEEQEDFILDAANIYIDYGLDENALEWMSLSKTTNNPEYKELLARILFGIGNFDECIKIFNELIDLNPYNKKYWVALSSAQFMLEDYNASITSSEYAIAIAPNDAEAIMSKASGLYKLENYEEALEYYKKYCSLMQDDEFGELQLASCLINLGMYEEAISHLEHAKSIPPKDSQNTLQILKELAFAYSATKDIGKAMECLEDAMKSDSDHIDLLLLKGHLFLENNKKEEANVIFKKAINECQDIIYVLIRIIVSLYDNKYIDEAYQLFKSSKELNDDNNNEGFSYMALCCWDLKKTKEFIHYLDLAVTRNPNEAKRVVGFLFPKSMNPTEYIDFIYSKLKKNQ